MDWALYLGPLLVLFSLVSLASFSAAGSAFLSISKNRLRREMEEKEDPRLRNLLQWREDPQTMLSVLAVGDYISIFAYVALTLWWIAQMSLASGWAWLTIVLALILLILAEVGLRLMGASHPLATLLRFSGFLAVVRILLAPLAGLFRIAAKGLFRAGSDLEAEEETEVKALAEMREEVEDLPAGQREMISAIFEFREKEVSEVMVPRMDIIALEQSTPLQQALRTLVESGHSRLPIYHEQVDNITGVLLEKDALRASLEDHPALTAADLARPPFFVPESKRISELLPEMQRKKTQIALVVDEYGGLEGLVTMEDILEEVVGEFTTDIAALSKDITPQDDGSFIVDASITLRNINRLLSWQLPAIGPRTLSGLIIEFLGYIPPADCCLMIEKYQIEVLKVSDNTIKSVRIIKIGKKRRAILSV